METVGIAHDVLASMPQNLLHTPCGKNREHTHKTTLPPSTPMSPPSTMTNIKEEEEEELLSPSHNVLANLPEPCYEVQVCGGIVKCAKKWYTYIDVTSSQPHIATMLAKASKECSSFDDITYFMEKYHIPEEAVPKLSEIISKFAHEKVQHALCGIIVTRVAVGMEMVPFSGQGQGLVIDPSEQEPARKR